jgi:hypothetical protein
MSFISFDLLKQKRYNNELFQRHYLNAINGLLSSGCTDYEKVVKDSKEIAYRAINLVKEEEKKEAFKFSDLLKV